MDLYPLFADLRELPVLVVGGGLIAERKVAALLEAGADVHVGAPQLTNELARWIGDGRIQHFQGAFISHWLDGMWLVIAATDDRAINMRVAAEATERRIFANVVDDPALSRFQVPAVIDRSPLIVAVSTGGAAPALARRLRETIESQLELSWGPLIELAHRHRRAIVRGYPRLAERRRFYDWLHDGPIRTLIRQQHGLAAEQRLLEAVQQPPEDQGGFVSLVGAGPGDASLLTLAALRRLQQADVILYDSLVGPDVLALARRDAERVEVGKRCGGLSTAQARIHELLLEHTHAGRHVVRLKGGDPFVFGRGGEEMTFLRDHGIAYEIVPGITAAVACAAYAGIPLTHREHAQSVRLVTAHCSRSLDTLDWVALAAERQTLVFYMGVSHLELLSVNLTLHGLSPSTPFALVENGTLPKQRVIQGTLAHLAELAQSEKVEAPALLIIGEVAEMAATHAWFGARTVRPEVAPPLSHLIIEAAESRVALRHVV